MGKAPVTEKSSNEVFFANLTRAPHIAHYVIQAATAHITIEEMLASKELTQEEKDWTQEVYFGPREENPHIQPISEYWSKFNISTLDKMLGMAGTYMGLHAHNLHNKKRQRQQKFTARIINKPERAAYHALMLGHLLHPEAKYLNGEIGLDGDVRFNESKTTKQQALLEGFNNTSTPYNEHDFLTLGLRTLKNKPIVQPPMMGAAPISKFSQQGLDDQITYLESINSGNAEILRQVRQEIQDVHNYLMFEL